MPEQPSTIRSRAAALLKQVRARIEQRHASLAAPQDKSGLVLGTDDRGRPIALSKVTLLQHVHIVGATGSGKTKLLEHMIRQSILSGAGALVIDPHGNHPDSRGRSEQEALEPIYRMLPTAVHGIENLRYSAGQLIRNLPTGQAIVSFVGQNGIETASLKVPFVEGRAMAQPDFEALRYRILEKSASASKIDAAKAHVARRRELLQAEASKSRSSAEPTTPESYRTKKKRVAAKEGSAHADGFGKAAKSRSRQGRPGAVASGDQDP